MSNKEALLFNALRSEFSHHIHRERMARQATVVLQDDGLSIRNGFGHAHSVGQGAPIQPDGLLDDDTRQLFEDIAHEAWQRVDTFTEKGWMCSPEAGEETIKVVMRSMESVPFATGQDCHMLRAERHQEIPMGLHWAHYDVNQDVLTPLLDDFPSHVILHDFTPSQIDPDDVNLTFTPEQGLIASTVLHGMRLSEHSDLTAPSMALLSPLNDGTTWVIEQMANHPDFQAFADQVLRDSPEVLAEMLVREHVWMEPERLNAIVSEMSDDRYATLIQHYPDALQYTAPEPQDYHNEITLY